MNDFTENVEILHWQTAPSPILDPQDPIASAREFVRSRFTDDAGRRLLHRHHGVFYWYTGTYYRQIEDEEVRTAVWEFLESARRAGGRTSEPFRPTPSRVGAVVDALVAVCLLDSTLTPPAWLGDEDRLPAEQFLACGNCLLFLPTSDLCHPTPDYFNLSASDVCFDPEASAPRQWLAFLKQVFGNDNQAIETLQDWCGYLLTTDTRQQKIALFIGPRRSGKGTVARVITGLLGTSSVAAPTLGILSTNFGLEPLIGKPLAILSDARLGSRSDQAAISERLLSISGEDTLTIDRKFRQAWTGKLSTRFMLLTNELPRISDASGALAGRFICFVLERSFYGCEDQNLTDKLLTELPGILNWALTGYRRLYARGHFIQPPSAIDTIEELETLGSPVSAFVRDKCRLGPGLNTPISLLYDLWRRWCEANGRREPGTVQTFGRDLRAAFPAVQQRRLREGEERYRSYEGIGLL
jgi:putative DNA primase/helicase